ncbi:MAG: SDR family oxidoreductase, partial [Alphaproteobacteria bacterium]|nr:SDR family oxidoreductase [Alphaproteobacteria bacterium]
MKVFVALPPGDTRPLPGDVRVAPRPAVLDREAATDPQAIARFISQCEDSPWIACGSPAAIRATVEAGGWPWLQGLETGGEVGTVVLIREAARSGRPWAVEGLGRRGMAAALAVGAHAVQIDVHTWLLAGSPLHPDHRRRLERRTARDTVVVDGARRLGGPVLPGWPTDPTSGLPTSTALGDITPGPPLAVWLPGFLDELQARVDTARRHHALRSDPFGAGTPIVQGPMANVSERPGLALEVRRAGGLPFCALGALRPEAAEAVLAGMSEVEEPWGAGVIGFDVMPWRDAHLDAVAERAPRPVILAGGSPALGVSLQARGLEPWLHTPSARLVTMALGRGVPAVVLEGREAGGHVGQLPSSALWEEGLAAVEAHGSPALVVLAGGIGDATSAAFAAAMSAGAHHSGHRVGLQVGTAFFFTHEIVETGGITPTYQQRALAAERTVLVGDTVGLPLQCVPSVFTDTAIAQEHAWQDASVPLSERRERVEHHNLGRTRIAARGIERDGHGGYRPVPAGRQLEEGAFTMGQGATVERSLTTVRGLMRALTHDAAALLEQDTARSLRFPRPRPRTIGLPATAPTVRREAAAADAPIAVVGLGCVLPGAPDVPSFWRQALDGTSAIAPVPTSRWPAHRYFHPSRDHRTTTSYVRMAGVVRGFRFDSAPFGIPPSVVPSMDRAQQLALVAAAEAIRGVRIGDRSRAAVLLGNSMGGEHAKSLAVRVRFREVLTALGHDGDQALEDAVDAWLGGHLPPVDVESMSGLLSNVIAGRVASWLDLGGGNATVDAACAASLGALVMATDALRAGRVDLVLTGGVDADLSPETFVGFCRTHALSPTGSQPFSVHADGFVMGEGAVVLALKRLPDALRDGDRVFATLLGVGQSSDGRSSGITAPKAAGQELAIRRALAYGDVDPATVHMIEAHGTGTAVGDPTEIEALARVYPAGLVTSVKSRIGHLKGAAGAAGLLQAVLAVHHGLVPASLNAGPLHPSVRRSAFRVPRGAQRFPDGPRRAAVSAFGFGGTDFHAVLEGHSPAESTRDLASPVFWSDRAAPVLEAFGAADRASLARAVRQGATCTPEDAVARPFRAVRVGNAPGLEGWIAGGGRGAFGRTAWVGEGEARPVVAVFPGQGSPREGAAAALMQVPVARDVLVALGETDPDASADPAAQHHLLVATGAAFAALLRTVDLAGVVGHSVGELSALCCAGRLTPAGALALADARGSALHDCPPGAMLAVAGEVRELPGCWVAAENSPGSWVAAGAPEDVRAARDTLRAEGVKQTLLDVERAFHTPHVAPAAARLEEALVHVPLADGLPWWPNVEGVGSRSTREEAGRALVRGVTECVGFARSLRAARDDGHTLFVHAGPGASLARHIERTVPDATVIALQPDREPLGDDLVRAAAALLAEGHVGVLRALPGTWVQVAFPREVPVRPTPTGAPLELPTAPEPEDVADVVVDAPDPDVEPGSVRDVVLRAVTEITGYPRAALVSGASLSTDLGIDSIRKLEIVGRIQDDLGIQVDEGALADAKDLDVDGLVAFVEGGSHAPVTPTPRGGPGIWQITRTGSLSDGWSTGSIEALIADLTRWCTTVPDVPPTEAAREAFLRVARAEAGETVRVEVPAVPATLGRPVPEAPVVLASGGTTGILASCLAALSGARGVVLGRRAEAEPPEGFLYVQCDVTDPAAVARAASACRERFGRIDMVIHAAGSLQDGPVSQATPEDVRAVLGPKLLGARNLVDATLDDAPALYVPFSSVSASLVNPGQALYAAANAALERIVHPTAGRTVPLAWTAWSSRGMAADPALQRLLAARGIHALAPDEGAELFRRALGGDGPLWLALDPPPAELPWPLARLTPTGWSVPLDPSDPHLADHVVAGSPLVPAALWLEALTAVAGQLGS